MSFVTAAMIGAGGALLGGYMASQGAQSAADAQSAAAQAGLASQERMFNKQVELQAPWREAGMGALNRLSTGLAQGGEFATPFSQTNWMQDPGYAFRLSEGQKALDRSAAARGGLQSGAALKAAARYGQDMGSQEYQNAFNRYYAERNNMLSPLQSLAGVGQTSANTLTNAAGQYGAAANETAQAMGNARASGYVGQANALNSALGGVGNAYMQSQMLNRLMPSYGYQSPGNVWAGTSLNQTFSGTGRIAD